MRFPIRSYTFFICLVAVVLISGCTTQIESLTHTDPTGLFSINYSSYWIENPEDKTTVLREVNKSFPGLQTTGVFLISGKSRFYVIAITMENTPVEDEVKHLLNQSIDNYETNARLLAQKGSYSYSVISSGSTEVGSIKEAMYILSEMADTKVKEKAISAVKGNYFIIVLHTSTTTDYDKVAPDVDKIISSLKLLKN